jgi:acyl dehydratase
MPVKLTLAALEACRDLAIGPSSWRTVDIARIRAFASTTEDEQWIHVDEERAATGPFGAPIAHGYLTLSLVTTFLFETIEIEDAGSTINYGIDELRFISPVRAGSEIRLRGSIIDAVRRKNGILYRLRVEIEVRGEERPALIGTLVFLALPAR